MRERRKAERQVLTAFTLAYDHEKDSLLGYLRDLSLNGALLVGSRCFEDQAELTVAIEFHKTPEVQAVRMAIPARVAWCRQEQRSDTYDTGIEFLELRAEDERVIRSILDRYRLRQDPPFYQGGWV